MFFDDAAFYNGRTTDLREKMCDVLEGMRSCKNFAGMISIPRFDQPYDVSNLPRVETWSCLLSSAANTPSPPFQRIPFHDPFLICYSSGTTGTPKAIVHSVGGALMNLTKESRLHEQTTAESVVLQYTTTGWIMYLLQVAQLISGARLVLYDGSPFMPDLTTFIGILAEQRVTKLGTSPRWIFEVAKNGIAPREYAELTALKIITSTGMVLSDQMFEWVYDVGFPPHVQLINMSGGTDIVS